MIDYDYSMPKAQKFYHIPAKQFSENGYEINVKKQGDNVKYSRCSVEIVAVSGVADAAFTDNFVILAAARVVRPHLVALLRK